MPVTLKQILDELPPDERKEIEARAQELIAEELTLRDLRKARNLTQKKLAKKLKIGQDSISRLEQRSDLLLSTLRSYVAAMGGELELVARFPGRPAVKLSGFTDPAEAPEDPSSCSTSRQRAKPRTRRTA